MFVDIEYLYKIEDEPLFDHLTLVIRVYLTKCWALQKKRSAIAQSKQMRWLLLRVYNMAIIWFVAFTVCFFHSTMSVSSIPIIYIISVGFFFRLSRISFVCDSQAVYNLKCILLNLFGNCVQGARACVFEPGPSHILAYCSELHYYWLSKKNAFCYIYGKKNCLCWHTFVWLLHWHYRV